MNTTAHSVISGSIAIALAVFTALSALFAGLAATPTLLGLSLVVGLGLAEITMLSYTRPVGVFTEPRRSMGKSNVMIAFPTTAQRRAA